MTNQFNLKEFLIEKNTYIIFIGLFIICALLSTNFLLPINLINILLQQSAPVLVAFGMLFVVLTGNIDLSVGSVMAISASMTCVLMKNYGIGLAGGFGIAIAIGLLCGCITGFIVAYCNMQGFVASLAIMTITRGIAYIITNGSPVKVPGDTLANLVKRTNCYPVIIIMLVSVVILWFIQRYTTYGRIIIAVGSNRTAVELAGIRVRRYLLSAYMVSGFLASIAGIFYVSRTSTGSASVGNGAELGAIAACVLGGANLAGGSGSVIKTFVGALILALIGNIMNLQGVGAYTQNVVQGILIIAAVLLQGIKKD
jgi:ribose transport system permease protein